MTPRICREFCSVCRDWPANCLSFYREQFNNRLLFDRDLQLQLNIKALQQLNILSHKQMKYCRKLMR